MDIITLQNAAIYQSEHLILKDVNFNLAEGEFAYLVGKTGSGKTSLMKTLYGEIPLKVGTGRLGKYNLTNISKSKIFELRRSLGIVFQDFQLLMDRNVEQNLLFVLNATGTEDKHECAVRIQNVLNLVGMEDRRYKMPHQLSGGEQQRIVIARALLNFPKLILADEPTANLDPDTANDIMDLLHFINQKYKTAVLMATHNYLLMEKFHGNIIRVVDGTIKQVHLETV